MGAAADVDVDDTDGERETDGVVIVCNRRSIEGRRSTTSSVSGLFLLFDSCAAGGEGAFEEGLLISK